MLVYSVTASVVKEVAPEWLHWMQRTHIPEVMATGFFTDYTLHRLVQPVVDPERVTFNIHYRCASMGELARYRKEAAPALQQAHQQRYGERVLAFRSILSEL
ncbi:MAG: DUF4286 family protein [Bacteroidetes bacterium]|nr:MAG: DUF4286 family protein [Bacteroidota bacterium]